MCFFDASDGHPILGHFARQVGRSGEIRGPGMTWMTYGCRRVDADHLTVSICFDMIFNYIKVGMLTIFISNEVEYENGSFKILRSCVKFEDVFLPTLCSLRREDI